MLKNNFLEPKPFAPACERNKAPILAELKRLFSDKKIVLEVGSGTGQHAVHFAQHLPNLVWQTSDLPEQETGIEIWCRESGLANLMPPFCFDVTKDSIPDGSYDAVFTANTFHIMPCDAVLACIEKSGKLLSVGGLLVIYGPFNFKGQYSAPSNKDFDLWLKSENPQQGIRDFEEIEASAKQSELVFLEKISLPANNHILVFKKE